MQFLKVIGKFGLNSKLSNTITIEANDNEIDTSSGNKKQTATGSSSGLNKINSDLKKLVDCCVPSGLKSCSLNSSLELIVKNTHDLCFILEDNYTFYAHKVILAQKYLEKIKFEYLFIFFRHSSLRDVIILKHFSTIHLMKYNQITKIKRTKCLI